MMNSSVVVGDEVDDVEQIRGAGYCYCVVVL